MDTVYLGQLEFSNTTFADTTTPTQVVVVVLCDVLIFVAGIFCGFRLGMERLGINRVYLVQMGREVVAVAPAA